MAHTYKLINASGSGGSGSGATAYTSSFNNTTDWGAASGGYYTITITEATHGKGTKPIVQIYELVSGVYEQVDVDRLGIAANGDVTIRVPESLDTRFTGRITILGE